ncbi:hypothetical protein KUF59_06695 [Bradyrhizobium arachidis]|nr:hypothetical protein KUF59_06695 [Bradyrhizobium arachidis]
MAPSALAFAYPLLRRFAVQQDVRVRRCYSCDAEGDAGCLDRGARSLAKKGLVFGEGTLRRFLVRYGITRKEMAHASEQDRPDVIKRRQDWLDGQPALDPQRCVFIVAEYAAT